MIMEKIDRGEEVGGAGGAYSYSALKRLDQIWSSLRDKQSGTFHIVGTLCVSIYLSVDSMYQLHSDANSSLVLLLLDQFLFLLLDLY